MSPNSSNTSSADQIIDLIPETEKEKFVREEVDDLKFQLTRVGLKKSQTALCLADGQDPVARALSELVGTKGRVVSALPLHLRIEDTKKKFKGARNVTFFNTDRDQIALDSEAVDFTYSKGVFSSTTEPSRFLDEMIRVTKRGGKVVAADIDWMAFCDYPIPDYLMTQLREFFQVLAKAKSWDLGIGRKLFALMHEAGLQSVKAHLFSHRLIGGQFNPLEREEWESRFDLMRKLQADRAIQLSFDLTSFRTELFAHFQNPERFAYAPMIVVEGIKNL